jgi:acetyl esterase/lipase
MSDKKLYTRRRLLAAVTAASLAGCSGEREDTAADSMESMADGQISTTETAEGTDAPVGATESPTEEPTTAEAPTEEPRSTAPVETVRAVTFRETPQRALKLDLYLPTGGTNYPFFVFAHGGAWVLGDKGERPMFDKLATEGYAVADAQYRLAQEKRYPAAVRDVVAAVKWVKANAAQYRIDASTGALAGYSAGAHLAALVGLAPKNEAFQPNDFEPDTSAEVDGIVGYSGPYDFTEPGARDNPLVENFFGEDADEEVLAEGSPVTHVDGDDPPALLFHGTDDGIVPYRSMTLLAETLRNADVPVEVFTGEGAGHGMINEPEWREQTLPRQLQFLDEYLRS